jgi:hypothetical protein
MADIAEITAELADIWPALAAALARDTAVASGGNHAFAAAMVVNPDVLHAMITLSAEIPETVRYACEAIAEPWQHRDLTACLRQVPRLAGRMRDLGLFRDERTLERLASGWLRMVKRALGLRRPDVPIGYDCPYFASAPDDHGEGRALLAAGEDGSLRQGPGGLCVEWVVQEVIYCASQDCAASWPLASWPLLGRLLRTPAMVSA